MKARNRFLLGYSVAFFVGPIIGKYLNQENKNTRLNAFTSFNLNKEMPFVNLAAYIDPNASVLGEAHIGRETYVAPFASIRVNEGLKIYIGEQSNVQDGAVLHSLKNFNLGENIIENSIFEHNKPFSIYIGDRVTLAQQSQVHGPCRIGSDTFIGMQSLVFRSIIGDGVVLEPGSKVLDVIIPKNRYVSAGRVISTQDEADNLPEITAAYKYFNFNQKVVDVNTELVRGYTSANNLNL